MIELFNFRLIKSGKHVEVYEYKDKKMLRGYKRKTKHNKKKQKNILERGKWDLHDIVEELERQEEERKQEQKQKTEFSIRRTRRNIRRITNSNPHLTKFLTLTFAQSMPDPKTANYYFKQFIKRILRAKPNFEYISVLEFQGDYFYKTGERKPDGGSVHYHLLCNIGEPKAEHLKDRFAWERWFASRYWKNGFVKLKDVNTVDNMGAYFCKYLSKDMFDTRMFNKKKFFCSRTLNKPKEIVGHKAKRIFEHLFPHMTKTYENTFEDEHTGTVEYTAYVLKK